MKLKEIYNTILSEFGILNEASLSRMLSKVKNNDFCIATAFRYSNSLQQNRQLNNELAAYLNSKKMGAYKLIGHWQEAPDGIEFKDAKPEQLSDSVEESLLFVRPNNLESEQFIKTCIDICKKYNQDAVLVGLVNNGIYLYYKDGSKDKIGSSISLNKTGQAYSQMRNKPNVPFIFEGLLQPSNNISKQVFKSKNLNF